MHDRLGDDVTSASCASLISSIEAHGQKHPALGRLRSDSDGFEIELVYGSRRLFAARHLGVKLLVTIVEIDDREALIEMDMENRARRDINPYEKGLSYARWLRNGLFQTQAELAGKLKVSEAQVSRLLQYASLPSVVVQAFGCGKQIREEWAVNLAKQCHHPREREMVIRRARQYLESPQKSVSPQAVYGILLNGSRRSQSIPAEGRDRVFKGATGTVLFRLQYRAKAVHFVLPRSISTYQVLDQIAELIQNALEPASTSVPLGDASVRALLDNGKELSHGVEFSNKSITDVSVRDHA